MVGVEIIIFTGNSSGAHEFMGIRRKDYNVSKPSQGSLENITGKTRKKNKTKQKERKTGGRCGLS